MSAPSRSASNASRSVSSMTWPSRTGSRLSGKRNVLNFIRCPSAGRLSAGSAPLTEHAIDFGRRGEVDAGVAERDPVEPLAEQSTGMRRRAVVVARQRPVSFFPHSDVAQIAALGGIEGQRLTL